MNIDSLMIDEVYDNELRNVLSVYKAAPGLISAKQKRFKGIAEYKNTSIKYGVSKFEQYEQEICELEQIYLLVENFKQTCNDEEKQILQLLLDDVCVPHIGTELHVSVRSAYRKIAAMTKRFIEFKKLGGKTWQKQQEQQQREM